jgi:hypothetical protein
MVEAVLEGTQPAHLTPDALPAESSGELDRTEKSAHLLGIGTIDRAAAQRNPLRRKLGRWSALQIQRLSQIKSAKKPTLSAACRFDILTLRFLLLWSHRRLNNERVTWVSTAIFQ